MKVERLTIENVQAIGRADIELGPLTVLVGPNGSGKTTALRCLKQALAGSQPTSGVVTISGHGWFSGNNPGPAPAPRPESFHQLPGPVYVRLDPSKLEAPSGLSSGPQYIFDGGEGLAGAITRLILERPELRDVVTEHLRAIVPGFQGVRSRPLGNGLFELRFDYDRFGDVSQKLVSTGTPTSLALLVLVYAERPANRTGLVALIDDPETGLHPGAQEELIRRLAAIVADDSVQIVLATHSPYVVDAAGAENVWVFGRGNDGRSFTRRLTDHPEASRSLNLLTAGEFWGAVGEDWVGKAS
jgi:predicted ATPase